jgi:NitT/TauT family transport system substrate-binding protein
MYAFRKTLTLASLLVFGGAAIAAAEPTKVSIGYPPATDFLAAYVAKEKGIFAKHNIDATLVKIPVVSNIPSSVVAGSIQIGMTTIPVVLQAVDGGLDLVLVAGAARHTKEHPFISLMARSDIKYEKPADLVGKTVGVPGINSVIDVMFRKWLLKNGVTLDKVKVVEGPLPQLPDMLKSGSVDYVCIVDPLRTRIVATKIGSNAAEYFAEVNPDVLVSGWLASGEWVKKNPEAVKGFRASIDEGLEYIRQHPEEAKTIEKNYIGYNSPSFPTFNNKARPEDLTFFIAAGNELKLYRTKLDPKKIVVP